MIGAHGVIVLDERASRFVYRRNVMWKLRHISQHYHHQHH